MKFVIPFLVVARTALVLIVGFFEVLTMTPNSTRIVLRVKTGEDCDD